MHSRIASVCLMIVLVFVSSSYGQDKERSTALPGSPSRPASSSAELARYFELVKPTYIDLVDGRIRGISLGCNHFEDAVIDLLFPTKDLLQIKGNAYGDRVSRRGLRTLLKCTNLESIKVHLPLHLDASTLELLGELTHLKELMLFDAILDPEGMEYLQGLNELELLYLPGTNLNDAMLRDIAPLKLTRLDVSETDVTQKGLLVFRDHSTLREVWVGRLAVDPEIEEQLAPVKVVRREHTADAAMRGLASDSEKLIVDFER